MILLAVFWGNRFNNGNQASGGSGNNPAKFSALESSPFLAQSIGVAPFDSAPFDSAQGGQDESIGAVEQPDQPSNLTGSSSPEAGARARTAGNPANGAYMPNVPESGVGLLSSAIAPSAPVFYRFKNDPAPNVGAQEVLVADLQSGETYLEMNENTRWPLASLTKLATAAVVMDNVDLKSALTLASADFSGGEETGFFKTGSVYSASDVLAGMLLLSKNEAAEALANNFGREKFINMLNEAAAEWGMPKTYFADPTGLSIADQSTPQDLKKLALHLYQNYPKILETTRRKSAVITELSTGKKTTVSNINLFAGRSDFLGGKTGYTDDANGNLLSIFSYERRPILVIVLGTGDRFGETEKLFNWFKNNFRANK